MSTGYQHRRRSRHWAAWASTAGSHRGWQRGTNGETLQDQNKMSMIGFWMGFKADTQSDLAARTGGTWSKLMKMATTTVARKFGRTNPCGSWNHFTT